MAEPKVLTDIRDLQRDMTTQKGRIDNAIAENTRQNTAIEEIRQEVKNSSLDYSAYKPFAIKGTVEPAISTTFETIGSVEGEGYFSVASISCSSKNSDHYAMQLQIYTDDVLFAVFGMTKHGEEPSVYPKGVGIYTANRIKINNGMLMNILSGEKIEARLSYRLPDAVTYDNSIIVDHPIPFKRKLELKLRKSSGSAGVVVVSPIAGGLK